MPSCILVALAFAAYAPSLSGDFLFDDIHLYILKNPVVHADDGLYRIWFTTQPIDFYPLTHTTFWFEWRIWGENTVGYRVFNVLLHAASAILIWHLLRRLNVGWAWLAAAMFVLHPVNVQAVAWISQRKSLLAATLGFASMLCYRQFDVTRRRAWYVASLVLCTLAHTGKSSMLMLPVVLVGYHLWQYGRIQRRDIYLLAPFFLVWLVFGLGGWWFMQHRGLRGQSMRSEGLLGRTITAFWAIWFYLYKDFVPLNLTLIYSKWRVDPSLPIVYVPGLALMAAAAVFFYYRRTWGRPFLVSLGYFCITMFPALGFFDVGHFQFALVADHYQYQSIIGVIALVVGLAAYAGAKGGPRLERLLLGAGGLVLGLLFVLTWRQSQIWTDSETLWRDVVTKTPNAPYGYVCLSNYLILQRRYEEALKHARRAVELDPRDHRALNNLGICLAKFERVQEAQTCFLQAIRVSPGAPESYLNLGNLVRRTDPERAARLYRMAIECDPWYGEAYNNLGALYARTNPDLAISYYRRALEVHPKNAETYNNLGNIYARKGRIQEAIAHYETALRLNPNIDEARRNLAIVSQFENNRATQK